VVTSTDRRNTIILTGIDGVIADEKKLPSSWFHGSTADGAVYQCDACLAPVFLRFAVKQYSENAIELYRNYIELERPKELFAFSYLPQHTETWRASS